MEKLTPKDRDLFKHALIYAIKYAEERNDTKLADKFEALKDKLDVHTSTKQIAVYFSLE